MHTLLLYILPLLLLVSRSHEFVVPSSSVGSISAQPNCPLSREVSKSTPRRYHYHLFQPKACPFGWFAPRCTGYLKSKLKLKTEGPMQLMRIYAYSVFLPLTGLIPRMQQPRRNRAYSPSDLHGVAVPLAQRRCDGGGAAWQARVATRDVRQTAGRTAVPLAQRHGGVCGESGAAWWARVATRGVQRAASVIHATGQLVEAQAVGTRGVV